MRRQALSFSSPDFEFLIFSAQLIHSNPKKSKIHPSNPTSLHQIKQKESSKSKEGILTRIFMVI